MELATIIKRYEDAFLASETQVLPSQLKATPRIAKRFVLIDPMSDAAVRKQLG